MVPKKREPKKCQKTELRGEKLSEACVARRTCYCRGFVAVHECCYERSRKHMTMKVRGAADTKGKEEESVLEFD